MQNSRLKGIAPEDEVLRVSEKQFNSMQAMAVALVDDVVSLS
ncbi:hypothetical protein [Streptococcus acidominimus]|nr:hypothetical protein [Streptococcus acidominimus]